MPGPGRYFASFNPTPKGCFTRFKYSTVVVDEPNGVRAAEDARSGTPNPDARNFQGEFLASRGKRSGTPSMNKDLFRSLTRSERAGERLFVVGAAAVRPQTSISRHIRKFEGKTTRGVGA